MPTATEMRKLAFEPCRDVREPEPSRPEVRAITPLRSHHDAARSFLRAIRRDTPHAQGASAVPAGGRGGCAARRDRPNLERGVHESRCWPSWPPARSPPVRRRTRNCDLLPRPSVPHRPCMTSAPQPPPARPTLRRRAPAPMRTEATFSAHVEPRSLPLPDFQNERRPTPGPVARDASRKGCTFFKSGHSFIKGHQHEEFFQTRKRIHSHRHPVAAPVGTCKRGHIGRAGKTHCRAGPRRLRRIGQLERRGTRPSCAQLSRCRGRQSASRREVRRRTTLQPSWGRSLGPSCWSDIRMAGW